MLVRTLPFMLTATLSIIIPASALVSTVMTYGRVASDNELVTMRASGIHVLRVIVPGVLFGLLASFFLLVINDWVVPRAQRRAKAMLSSESLMEILDTGLLRGKRELQWASYLLTWEDCRKVELPEGKEDERNPLRRWRFYGFRAKEYDEEKFIELVIDFAIPEWHIMGEGGEPLECTVENKIALFDGGYPRLAKCLIAIARIITSRHEEFLKHQEEVSEKNSKTSLDGTPSD